MYYTTHMNDPIVCAVGAKVCEILERDGMAEIARDLGKIFKDGLQKVSKTWPLRLDLMLI